MGLYRSRSLALIVALGATFAQAAEPVPGSPPAASMPAAAAPSALDEVPAAMPFDAPYGAPIGLEKAQALVQAAMVEARKRGWALSISVVDSAATPIAFARMDGAHIASAQIATDKATTAVKFRRPTKVFETAIQSKGYNYLLSMSGIVASRGGLPIMQGEKIVGGIGCSGGTGSQDEVVCQSALAGTP